MVGKAGWVLAVLVAGAAVATVRVLPAAASVLSYTELPQQPQQATGTVPPGPLNYDTEPYVAVDPANAQHVVIGWMRKVNEYTNVGMITPWVAMSSDGGATWTETQLPADASATIPEQTSADVTIAFGPDGTVYADHVAYVGPNAGQIWLHRSTDGGLTWSQPVIVSTGVSGGNASNDFDRPWVLVDNTNGPYRGRVYVASMTFFADSVAHVYVQHSSDGGQTFSTAVQVDSATRPAHSTAIETWAIGPDGELAGVYRTANPVGGTGCGTYCFTMATSTDGGQTFTTLKLPANTEAAKLADGNEQDPWAVVAADPTTAGHYAVAWPDSSFSAGSELDIALTVTRDHGATWSPLVKVNDGAANAGSLQDHPWLTFSAAGTLYMSWRDRRNTSGATGAEAAMDLYATASTDGGTTVEPNLRLSPASVPGSQESAGDDFIGQAVGSDGVVTTAWAALNGSGDKMIWVARWSPASAGAVVPTLPAPPLTLLVFTAGAALLLLFRTNRARRGERSGVGHFAW